MAKSDDEDCVIVDETDDIICVSFNSRDTGGGSAPITPDSDDDIEIIGENSRVADNRVIELLDDDDDDDCVIVVDPKSAKVGHNVVQIKDSPKTSPAKETPPFSLKISPQSTPTPSLTSETTLTASPVTPPVQSSLPPQPPIIVAQPSVPQSSPPHASPPQSMSPFMPMASEPSTSALHYEPRNDVTNENRTVDIDIHTPSTPSETSGQTNGPKAGRKKKREPYHCLDCSYTTHKLVDLIYHNTEHEGNYICKSLVCNFRTNSKEKMAAHARQHRLEKLCLKCQSESVCECGEKCCQIAVK